MTKTEKKLQEAQFFLTKLESLYPRLPESNYYLSAFISSARSILWVMRAEFSKINGWKNWYEDKNPSQREKDLLKQFNDLRVRIVKLEPVDLKATAKILIPKKAFTPQFKRYLEENRNKKHRLVLKRWDGPPTKKILVYKDYVNIPMKYLKKNLEVSEFSGEDTLLNCKQYIKAIADVVLECRRKFPISNKSFQRAVHTRLAARLHRR